MSMDAVNFQSFFRSKYTRVLTLALLAQAVLFYTASHGDSTPLPQPLASFPKSFGDWTLASEGVVEKETMDVLRADDTLTRWYQSPEGGANLFIAYFKTQRTGQSPHSPKNCLPGSGWTPSSEGFMNVSIPGRNESIRINRYIVAKGAEKSVVLYWYQTQNRVIASEFEGKYWLIMDSIRHHRSNTAIVRVVVPVSGDREAQAVKTGVDFVQSVFPVLLQNLPA